MKDSGTQESVEIETNSGGLQGVLCLPSYTKGLILFAHGSGSSRHSTRNKYVASILQRSGFGTLLFDLLTEDEASDRGNTFDISLLAGRLVEATNWTSNHIGTKNLEIGYFGASTGGAAALHASVDLSIDVFAVVSRGGRPDMAFQILNLVKAPTLLIVGGDDLEVLELNRIAYDRMNCEKELSIVQGATHLFEESGKLEEVARLATEWFLRHVGSGQMRK